MMVANALLFEDLRLLSVIVAQAENGIIGRDGELPWRISQDLQRFKRLTMGHHLIMGRTTFESIGRLLPGRTSVVITRQTDYEAEGAVVVHDVDSAIEVARDDPEAFVIGGGQIYAEVLPRADCLYLTQVHAEVEGDVRFDWDPPSWRLDHDEWYAPSAKNQFAHSFRIYRRR